MAGQHHKPFNRNKSQIACKDSAFRAELQPFSCYYFIIKSKRNIKNSYIPQNHQL